MFHNSSNLYRNYNMPGSKGAGRDFADITQNIARAPVNALVIAPARLVNQMFNLNHQIDYIKSRHERRVDKRIAAGQPLTSAAKATQVQHDAKHAALQAQKESYVAFEAAVLAYDTLFRNRDVMGELEKPAVGAMKKLFRDDLITEKELNNFKNSFSSASDAEFTVRGKVLPLSFAKFNLCRAAIGQAWIDKGFCNIENAVPEFKVTEEACATWSS